MSNKITEKDLGKMIKEALLNEVTQVDLEKFIKGRLGSAELSKGQEGGLPSVGLDDLFVDKSGLAHADGQPPDSLTVSDIDYYIQNPEKIGTKLQSQLIALTKWKEPRLYAVAQTLKDAVKAKQSAYSASIKDLGAAEAAFNASSLPKNVPVPTKPTPPKKVRSNAKNRAKKQKQYDKDLKAYPGKLKTYQANLAKRQAYQTERDEYSAKKTAATKLRAQTKLKKASLDRAQGNLDTAKDRLDTFRSNKAELNKIADKAQEALDTLEIEIEKAAKKNQSLSSPTIKTAKGDYGLFDQDQQDVVMRLLSSKTTIKDRISEVSRISKDFYDAVVDKSKLETKKPSQLLSEIMLIDLCNSMTKEFDSGSGAYLFEHFLAMIVGGVVAGKTKTEYGKMGVADFKMGNEFGSAKFYQNPKSASQAVNGYKDLYRKNNNQPVSVTYVIGGKKQDVEQMGDPLRGVSDPARIIGIEVYTPKVVYDGANFRINGFDATPEEGGSDISFSTDDKLGEPAGMIYLTTTRTSTFKEMLDSGIKQQEAEVQNLFEQFKTYFKELESASSTAKSYITTGDTATGNKTYESLANAESSFSGIVSGLEYDNTTASNIETGKTSIVQEEQKVTSDLLKKIIKETLRK